MESHENLVNLWYSQYSLWIQVKWVDANRSQAQRHIQRNISNGATITKRHTSCAHIFQCRSRLIPRRRGRAFTPAAIERRGGVFAVIAARLGCMTATVLIFAIASRFRLQRRPYRHTSNLAVAATLIIKLLFRCIASRNAIFTYILLLLSLLRWFIVTGDNFRTQYTRFGLIRMWALAYTMLAIAGIYVRYACTRSIWHKPQQFLLACAQL